MRAAKMARLRSVYRSRRAPYGVNSSPDGTYALGCGRLSLTVPMFQLHKRAEVFAGRIKPRDAVVPEPEVGLGPLHEVVDCRGIAYTAIFLDAVISEWNIDEAMNTRKNKDGKTPNSSVQRSDLDYQAGHISTSMSEPSDAPDRWIMMLY